MSDPMISIRSLCLALVLGAPAPLAAHEFWIEPQTHWLTPGETLAANLKVGQDFKGALFPYLRDRFLGYTITDAAGTRDNKARDGDIPSLLTDATEPGLIILGYHSTADRLEYDAWEQFVDYATYEGHEAALDAHLAADLPRSGFSEDYTRCAKALVQVGPPSKDDRDRALGLPFELVALDNPFLAGLEEVEVALLRAGAPAPDIQIAVFRMGDPVTRTLVRTDEAGRATVALDGGGRFLLNAVDLRLAPQGAGVAWESWWASLTFEARN